MGIVESFKGFFSLSSFILGSMSGSKELNWVDESVSSMRWPPLEEQLACECPRADLLDALNRPLMAYFSFAPIGSWRNDLSSLKRLL